MLLETYRRSLKMPAAEEFFDLIFYRPAAYLCVLGFAKTPVTPNQITILSLIAGCIAAYELSFGTYGAYIAAGICYATANILDCADGQLARIKKNGTPLGRLVDGIADYISSIAIFLGIGFGLGTAGTSQWWLVVAAGVSSALHAIKFDDVQGRFIAIVKDEKGFTSSEIEKYKTNIAQLQRS
ncbi:MAG: CDP-alcohol phosphatidyltransferase family protein, partial [Bacteroidetes bacterium]